LLFFTPVETLKYGKKERSKTKFFILKFSRYSVLKLPTLSEAECISLEFKSHHFITVFPNHKQFGKHVHRYQRNKNTTWYIVYDKDEYFNIYIQRIFSNHTQNQVT